MAKTKSVKTKSDGFEKDEKKSIIIALIVSAIVVLALVLAFIAIGRHSKKVETNTVATESTESAVTLEGNSIVTNQEELNSALTDPDCYAILFETEEEESIVVAAGDYSDTDLIINAPYTEVTNYGTFNSVTIQQIAANTWTEGTNGNSIVVDSAACHIIVPSGVSVSSIEAIQPGSSLAIENYGTISMLTLEAEGAITSVQVDGEMSQIIVYNQTNLTLSGKAANSTAVEISYGTDGTTLTSSIPVNVNSFASSVMEFQTGAENSVISLASNTVTTSITNNTSAELTVMKASGEEDSVAAGESVTYEAEEVEGDTTSTEAASGAGNETSNTGSSSTSSGSSGGSGSKNSSTSSGNKSSGSSGTSSSGVVVNGYTKEQVDAIVAQSVADATKGMITSSQADALIAEAQADILKQVEEETVSKQEVQDSVNDTISEIVNRNLIVSFVNPEPIYAGVAGKLKNITDVESMLPESVQAMTLNGNITTVKVTGWENADNYSTAALGGEYRFIPVLEINELYMVQESASVYAKVFVGTDTSSSGYSGEDFVYENKEYQDKISISVRSGSDDSSEIYYGVKNISENNTESIHVDFKCYFFDENGKLIPENTAILNGRYIAPGRGWVFRKGESILSAEYEIVEVCAHSTEMTSNSPVYYSKDGTLVDNAVTVWTEKDGIVHVHNSSGETLSELTILVLYLDKNGHICGKRDIVTGREQVQSINDMNSDFVSSVTNLPKSVDYSKTIVYLSGGYVK